MPALDLTQTHTRTRNQTQVNHPSRTSLSVNTSRAHHRERLYANSPSPLSSPMLPPHTHNHMLSISQFGNGTPMNTPTVGISGYPDLSALTSSLSALTKTPSEDGTAFTPTHGAFPHIPLPGETLNAEVPLILNRKVLHALRGNMRGIAVLRKRLLARLSLLRTGLYDHNGNTRKFITRSHIATSTSNECEEECIDREGFMRLAGEMEWERGLFAMDSYIITKEILELEGAIQELEGIVPACR